MLKQKTHRREQGFVFLGLTTGLWLALILALGSVLGVFIERSERMAAQKVADQQEIRLKNVETASQHVSDLLKQNAELKQMVLDLQKQAADQAKQIEILTPPFSVEKQIEKKINDAKARARAEDAKAAEHGFK